MYCIEFCLPMGVNDRRQLTRLFSGPTREDARACTLNNIRIDFAILFRLNN